MNNRIVIADDDKELVNVLSRRCQKMGLSVDEAGDGFEAGFAIFVATNPKEIPKLFILDVNMPIDDGLSICEEISREAQLAKVPVIVLTGRKDFATIERCRQLGVHYVHKSGDVWRKLEPIIREALSPNGDGDGGAGNGHAEKDHAGNATAAKLDAGNGDAPGRGDVQAVAGEGGTSGAPTRDAEPLASQETVTLSRFFAGGEQPETVDALPSSHAGAPAGGEPRAPAKVLVVEDDYLLSAVLEKRLSKYGVKVERAFTGGDGYWKALKEQPDMIITDYVMPDGYGSYLLRRLREHPLTASTPVIVLTGCDMSGRQSERADYSLERRFLSMGAECVLRKPIDYDALVRQMRRHVPLVDEEAEEDAELASCT